MDSVKTRAALALLLTMIFWGSAAVFMRTLALSLSPENSLALRYVFITAINIAGLAILGGWRVQRQHWGRFLIAGLVGMGGYNAFVNAGFELVPAGVGTIITMVEPMMIAVLAWFLLREPITAYVLAGIAVATLGAVVLFWPDLTADVQNPVPPLGIAYLMICCLCWAIYTVVCKPLFETYSGFTVTAVTMLISAPPLIALATEPLWTLAAGLDARQWFEVAYLVLPSGIIGTLLWNYGSKHLSGGVTGSFLYLIPVVAVVGGALVLGEAVTIYVVAGGALILTGVALAQFGPLVFRR
jgi:drug/metabolite transporter (DMT)-like permease